MDLIIIRRILRAGFLDFWRNKFVSFSLLLAITEALFIFGIVLFCGVILSSTLSTIQSRTDMSITFLTSVSEEQVLEVQTLIEARPEVATVEYISREDALSSFRESHKDDQLTLQALEELGENPFGARLVIDAHDISQYEAIAKFVQSDQVLQSGEQPIIDRVSYYDPTYQLAFKRLQGITESAARLGIIMVILFVLTTVTICFNLVRLAIYISKDEIQVMRLVGAGSGYIRAPFMVQGALQGLVAGVVTLLLFYPSTYWLRDATFAFADVDVFAYYLSHFPLFFLLFVGGGLFLGGLLNFLAVRRYLKI